MKPRVVLDTNVFIATSFNPGSSSARIIETIRAGELEFVWDEKTMAETEKMVRRIPRIQWSKFQELFTANRKHATDIDKNEFAAAIADPDDRKFAALAKSSGAVIISSDSDLLDTQAASGVVVLSPSAFVARYLV